jgi:hypothetical protein
MPAHGHIPRVAEPFGSTQAVLIDHFGLAKILLTKHSQRTSVNSTDEKKEVASRLSYYTSLVKIAAGSADRLIEGAIFSKAIRPH